MGFLVPTPPPRPVERRADHGPLSCRSCGAPVLAVEPACSYCGTVGSTTTWATLSEPVPEWVDVTTLEDWANGRGRYLRIR